MVLTLCKNIGGMKKVIGCLVAVLLCSALLLAWAYVENRDVTQRWKIAEANVKAYSEQLGKTNMKSFALQLTVDQLKYFNDSVLMALDETRKNLKVKDKNLKALQAVSSKFSRTDTIRITQVDTLFKEPSLAMDTVLGDSWYTLNLGLKYPSMITVKPEFKSEKHIIVSTKKETVNPPKKFFLLRWFQKKMTVIHIDVVEKNPYVDDESSEYIEIIK